MDKVFQEEEKQLAETEYKLETIASRYERKATRLSAEILDYYCVDNEDRMRKRELIQDRESALNSADRFRSYQPSPYFGRLDLDNQDGYETSIYYIGKTGISDGADVIVIDWRTPIGSCFYASNQKEFSVNGTNYLLALRRSLDVKDAVLVSYRTDYDGEIVSLEGDVIDPFLLTVLKDKRRHNRLTDIIRTIQGNQNEIIRKPRAESFVVQGCAGSGKTMILLHRLSFLKFNNRNMSFSGVKIITPNKFFDAHINDLSNELGLTAIERFSVEEYYVHLIKRYSNKIDVDANVHSEKILNADLLSVVYSLQYLQDSISHYHDYWDQILSMIDEKSLHSLFSKHKIVYPNTQNHTADTASQLEHGIKQISALIADSEKKKKDIVSRISSNEKDIATVQTEYAKSHEKFESIKNQTISRIVFEIEGLISEQANSEENIREQRKQRDTIKTQLRENEAVINNLQRLAHNCSYDTARYFEFEKFILQNDEVSALIRVEFKDLINTIIEEVNAFDKIPVYNFGKRNNLRKQITVDKEAFAREVSRFVSDLVTSYRSDIYRLRGDIGLLNSKLTDITNIIRDIEKKKKQRESYLSSLRECITLLESVDMPDLRTALVPSAYRECADLLAYYEEQWSILNRIIRRLNSLQQTKQNNEIELQKLTNTSFTYEENKLVSESAKTIKKLQFREITRSVMLRDLLAEYKLHDQKYQKTNYRHKLYLRLLFASLYFSRIANPDNFLNIDEAQDISVAEYHLLRMVLGDRCVFNLYGDINQSVYSYKGVSDWDEISDITGGNIYVLNENYRNTLQITEFCNEEFGAEVYPIGISGEPVAEMNTAAAVDWILDIKKQNPDYRVAILHRHGLKAMQDKLHILLEKEDVSWYSVDENKLSILSVETAKGLEFEAVVVLVDQMSNNEKYISYTRALDRLVVVRDPFSNELDVDNLVEGIDDEFDDPTIEYSEEHIVAFQKLISSLKALLEQQKQESEKLQHQPVDRIRQTIKSGKYFSWEIVDEFIAIKTCDKTFFAHNESGVPKEICWFFDPGILRNGESKKITLLYDNKHFEGRVLIESSERISTGHSRMRIIWNNDLGNLLSVYRDIDSIRAVFHKTGDNCFSIRMLSVKNEIASLVKLISNRIAVSNVLEDVATNEVETSTIVKDVADFSEDERGVLLEFTSILEERFGSNIAFSSVQKRILCELYRGNNVALNAPSGSMKTVMLYLLAQKEHHTTGKQTILTAESHLQENELVLAERLGLKSGVITDSMDTFLADFKKDKYDIIFVPYEFFKSAENISAFTEYFREKITYWGVNHPISGQTVWAQLKDCCKSLSATMYLMSKEGFGEIDIDDFQFHEIISGVETSIINKQTFISAEERFKWLLSNLDKLHGQGLIYCNDEATCKTLSKSLRKNKMMAEAYVDVFNPEKKERINYLTNSFAEGGLPILVTTHEVGKNLSNHRIRFIVHFDVPESNHLHMLHASQIGPLSENPVVYDFYLA